jgi:hypothetical protein
MRTIAASFALTIGLLIAVTAIHGDVLPGGGDPPERCVFGECDINCWGPATFWYNPVTQQFQWNCVYTVDFSGVRSCVQSKDINADGVNDCKCTCRYILIIIGGTQHHYCSCQLT